MHGPDQEIDQSGFRRNFGQFSVLSPVFPTGIFPLTLPLAPENHAIIARSTDSGRRNNLADRTENVSDAKL